MRRAALLVSALAVAACSLGSPYFEPTDSTTMTSAPALIGEKIVIGSVWLEAKPSDRVKLIDAMPVETTGTADVVPSVLVVSEAGEGVGAWSMDEPFPGAQPSTLRDLLRPLPGFEFTAETGDVQVAFAVTLASPGAYSWTTTRLTYRVAGLRRSQSWNMGGTVCADDPRPAAACEAPE